MPLPLVRSRVLPIFAAFVALSLVVRPARAEVVFNWGAPVFSSLYDSYGAQLDGSYTFELGAFDPSFAPTALNVTSWAANWKIFDQASYNVPAEHFASTADMLDNGTSSSTFATPGYDFRGLDAYIWGYNTKSYVQTLEWVWFRAPSWVFPASVPPGPPVTPVDWSISDLVAGDIPLWGAQNTAIGLGYASAPGVYDLQTYTLEPTPAVPEPSTLIFGALLVVIAVLYRLKRARTAKLAAALVVFAVTQIPSYAARINYYSSPDALAYGSDGQPLGGETCFELGVFANGFVPNATNTAQWSANWVPAQRTKFSAQHNWFTSICSVTNNAAPFTAGTPAYVWGFSGSEAQGQWILYRATDWEWPVADDTTPQPLFWSAKDANEVIVGSLAVANGDAVGLRPVAVANSLPPVTTWGQFQADNMANAVLKSPGDDADGDGVSNILEFALGTAPDSAADRPASPDTWARTGQGPDGKTYLEVRVPRRRDRAVNFSAELSTDLSTWSSGTNTANTVEDTVEALTLRDKTPVGEGGTQRFMRVKAVAAP